MQGSLVKRDEPLMVTNVGNENATSPRAGMLAKEAAIGGALHSNQLLNMLLPPIVLKDDEGNSWRQYVSSKKPTRDDVFELQERLDEGLTKRQARNKGICPVREDLYSQSFDELLRQIAIQMPERGLMLLRVRDEIRMTLAAYTTLYMNATGFGVRKAMEAEKATVDLDAQVKELEEKKQKLYFEQLDLQDLITVVERHETDKTKAAQEEQATERDFLQRQIQQLEQFLNTQQ